MPAIHGAIINVWKNSSPETMELFVQVLLAVKEIKVLKLSNSGLDGSKIYTDAFKSKVVSFIDLLKSKSQLLH